MSKSRTARGFILVAAAGALLSLSALAATSVDAAKGGKGGGGQTGGGTASITLNQTGPHLGDWVTFTTSGGSRINVACYQGGVGNMVYSADQATGTAFLLGGTSSAWRSNGGDALCYAWLYSNARNGFLAATSFTAGGAR